MTTNGERQKCGKCGEALIVYSTRLSRDGKKRIRWYRCKKCGDLPDKNTQYVPIEYAPARKRRTSFI